MAKDIRVRYAPSPTGLLHIGNARTALFNYLYARHHGGTFIIRIEDTDRKRHVEDGERSQLDNLRWLGIDWDESPETHENYRQSERLPLYQKYIDQLLAEGKAYKSYVTEEELAAERERQEAAGETPRYINEFLGMTEEEKAAYIAEREAAGIVPTVRLAVNESGIYKWHDIVKGDIEFEGGNIGGDWVIQKKDGYPTYNSPLPAAVPPEQVVGIVDLVPALAEDGTAVLLADLPGGGFHPGGVGDGQAGKDLGLRDVGRDDLCQREQLLREGLHGVVPQQPGAGGGHHHRVHHDVFCLIEAQPLGDGADERCRGDHADLHGVGVDVGEHGVQLSGQKLRRRLKDAGHTGGVLCGQGRDGTHGKDAVGRHGLDVGLDAGTATGITARNGQCGFHEIRPLFCNIGCLCSVYHAARRKRRAAPLSAQRSILCGRGDS